jgi:soluble lytic murein transglycosylase-like protein
MSKFSKLAAIYLFILLLGMTFVPTQPIISMNSASRLTTATGLPPEQDGIARYLAVKYSKPKKLVNRIVQSAYQEGVRFGLSPLTLLAIIEKESGLRHEVVNDYGAVGLMQVVPRFHRDKLSAAAEEQLKMPETNIHVGAKILSEYLAAKDGDLEAALKKYSGNARSYSQRVAYYEEKLVEVQSRSKT